MGGGDDIKQGELNTVVQTFMCLLLNCGLVEFMRVQTSKYGTQEM